MSKILRGLAAGYGAKVLGNKLGCGCVGTVLLFILLWMLLGNFSFFQ
ncbi:MAG: hypothetical protein RBU21_07555 [FCB group bacterium]|jgi:hypothetical protein|nr:hypothetical protein [FCB group bacterium]